MKIGCTSDVGMIRELDEDTIAVVKIDTVCETESRKAVLLVVADGMGGHNAGEVASRLAVKGVTEKVMGIMLGENQLSSMENSLKKAIEEVNRDVYSYVERNPQYKGMGTTMTVALILGSTAYFGNVGDSRGYIIDKREINQITKDHSVVQEMVDSGEITQEEARTHPQKNIITQAIGVHPDIEADTVEEYIWGDDFLLLCCDGLTDMLTDEEIHTVFVQHNDPQTLCDTLVKKANDRGGFDNISVIVAQFDELPKSEGETYVKRAHTREENTNISQHEEKTYQY